MATITAPKPTTFLLESNLKWNPLLPSQNPFKPFFNSPKISPAFKLNSHKPSRICSPKCFFSNNSTSNVDGDASNFGFFKKTESSVEIQENPVDKFAKFILKAFKALQKPAVAAVLVGLLLMYDPNSALAASGGRVGGKSFSSSRSFSSSSSRSYSVPRMSGGSSFSYSAPYYAPSPFGFGGGGVYVGPAVGFGSSFFLIMVGFAAFVLVSGFLSDRSEGGVLTATGKTSVLKLQVWMSYGATKGHNDMPVGFTSTSVGLLGLGRTLQRDLDRIAETADTSSPEGLSYVLTETTLALLRHPDYCISAYSSADVKRSMDEGEKRFNKLSIEERGKFDEETLVNVNNIKKRSSTGQRASGFSNEYIVVTILVAAEGVHKLPTINSSSDLKEALQKLASIPSSKTLAVEVLWTPQNEDDALSERELLQDYPLLRPL
ncbi:FLUCTUATING-LIGHT-ACCLIMATION protein 1, chloroplastic-like isoform X1 [Coffea arabica]|uniref:FLUCTUATING-LIGHT-ACCLIMATION protein 1, chloroplastic-like isoform X1 n=1 Tax=Coffea arabica TaxID=13443 RepID=A0ABM4WYE7_COFAR